MIAALLLLIAVGLYINYWAVVIGDERKRDER